MWRKVGCITLIVVVVAVIAAVIYQQTSGEDGGFFKKPGSKKEAEEKDPFFEAVRTGELTITVEATGATEPITDIDVKSEATGRITDFYVEEGDMVQTGDLICKLDQSNQLLFVEQQQLAAEQAKLALAEAKSSGSSTQRSSLESTVESAKANLASAEESHTNAKTSFDRINELYGKGYATDQEIDNARQAVVDTGALVDSARSSLENAQFQLEAFQDESMDNAIEQARLTYERARVQLAEARKQLGDSVIYSPIDGIILEKQLDVGDSVVSINSAYGGGNTIVRVADMRRMQVRTSVDEVDIGKIKVDQSATLSVDTYFDREFEGEVTNVYPQGVQSGTGLVSFIVIIEVDNTEGLLLGNMTANVRIEADVQKDKLLIPLAATRAGEEPDSTIVYVMQEGEDPYDEKAKSDEREIKVGDTDYYDIVVLDGLEEGEMIKVRGFGSTIRFGG